MAEQASSPAFPISLPALIATITGESAVGKTTIMTVVADILTLAKQPFVAFQADDKPRLQQMLGARVVDLTVDPDRLIEHPSLLRTAYTPVYTACSEATRSGTSVLLDSGARELEHITSFMDDVGLNEDLQHWKLPMLAFVPLQADPESIGAAAVAWRRLRDVVPDAHLVLVENLHDRGRIDRLRPQSPARKLFEKELVPLVADAPRLVMPMLVTDFWQPFEESGTRFLKVMALDAEEGAKRFSMSVGDFKIARGNVTRFFRHMQAEMAKVIALQSADGRNG
ncbi:hypothetical protein NS226_17400 [Aureimonas ureilytica]|uniref:CobQ/CobB/MinD/ParA nucleotide binding domain-containing protein n=1 Tax=Aureimonas ureilytica TaxID=401562 RepID=A0A175R4E6_9HYPH|nr:hypothetical protein [Aureimonas ureilytica]KTQ88024.1 hypothetical protein NS226_17400 [Aureimonas ureilytica]